MTEPDSGRFGLLRSGVIVSAMTFLSRILGLVRDVVIAFFFGSVSYTHLTLPTSDLV